MEINLDEHLLSTNRETLEIPTAYQLSESMKFLLRKWGSSSMHEIDHIRNQVSTSKCTKLTHVPTFKGFARNWCNSCSHLAPKMLHVYQLPSGSNRYSNYKNSEISSKKPKTMQKSQSWILQWAAKYLNLVRLYSTEQLSELTNRNTFLK